MITKRTSDLPLICLVCGDVARGINFHLMTCMSCKTFFRRHARKAQTNLHCPMENNCNITQRTRGICSACRLKKCLALGMDPTLVGNCYRYQIHSKQIQYLNKKKTSLPQPLPLSLLRNDRSTLTTNEWNLLSNILHAYDAGNIIPQTRYLLEQQSLLPPKLRSKSAVTFDIIKHFFSLFQPLIERTPYFHDLPTETSRTLVRNNFQTFGTLNSIFILREVNASDYLAFLTGCNTIYGAETMERLNKLTIRLERNGIFIKIMFLILAFSTNCGVVSFDHSVNLMLRASVMSVLHIENILITMFWKYLIYQFGFFEAVRWLNAFIKYILDVLQSSSEQPNVQHNDMVETIIEETAHLLTIDD